MGLQMHRNSKIVCTALGTVLSHQSTAQFHSQNYYVTFSWGFLLLHTKSLNNGRKDFNTIANSNDLLILFFLLIPYLHLLTIFLKFSYFFLIFSPWLAGVSFTFSINPMLSFDVGNNFPSLLSIINIISGFLKKILFIFK